MHNSVKSFLSSEAKAKPIQVLDPLGCTQHRALERVKGPGFKQQRDIDTPKLAYDGCTIPSNTHVVHGVPKQGKLGTVGGTADDAADHISRVHAYPHLHWLTCVWHADLHKKQ
jgi:hypothetical protein